ncbi:MAG TPA: DegT/DnrJ/EryC1/StrS family aminotransferase, partial [Verrucomicrobiae bacterium]|nr:DegT/DnrJ/EryC1/StrS family aminotransferase [Verrucomicrobiae bacterium]
MPLRSKRDRRSLSSPVYNTRNSNLSEPEDVGGRKPGEQDSRPQIDIGSISMNVSFYGHVRQYHNIQAEIDSNIREVLESGQYVMGPALKRFEKEFADYHGIKYACGVGNGTDALWLAFQALGIGPGDECITTANTFFATAEAIWIAGA